MKEDKARVRLGHTDLTVRPVGLGCMGMSQFYGDSDDQASIGTIRAAIGHNEQLIGTALQGRRDRVVLATKFGAKINATRDGVAIDGRPVYVAAACEASLRRLGTDVIDLYYYHRLDRTVPIEDTVGASVAVSADEIAYLNAVFAPGRVVGERYNPVHAATVAR